MPNLRILPANFLDASADLAVDRTAALPVTNLQNLLRGDCWRSSSTAPQVITGTWGGNVRVISSFGVWPSGGASSLIGSAWRLELFGDTAMSVSLFDQTFAFFPPAGEVWGTFAWGATPWGVEKGDLTARLAPLLKYFSPVNASAFRITVTNLGHVDTPYFESRRVWLADYIEAPYNPKYGAAPKWNSASSHKRTVGGSLPRQARARWREMRIDTMFVAESDRAKWSDLMYLADPAAEIVLSAFPQDATARRERDYTVMGSLDVLNPFVFENFSFHTLQLAIVES